MSKSPMRIERERRGWTLDYIAQQVGVSSAQISRIETEGVKSAETAIAVAKLFGNLTLADICTNPGKKPAASEKLQKAS